MLDERFLLRQDCPAFPLGGHAQRPEVRSPFADLALAGDFVAMPIPSALMERAAASGFLAANSVLEPLGVRAEPIRSVPRRASSRRCACRGSAVRNRRPGQTRREQRVRLLGRALPVARSVDSRPDWQQSNPAWIAAALRRSQELPSGGWYVLDAARGITDRPRRFGLNGRSFVAFRDGGRAIIAPDACPHLGASLSGGRPAEPIFTVLRLEAACEPRDVIANRLDPWHGAHFHAHSFSRLRVIDQRPDEITVRVAYRVLRPLAVEVDARFHCVDPRTIVMTVVRGEGEGSVVETHATPIEPGRTAIVEATLSHSDRRGFAFARTVAPLLRPLLRAASRRLWIDDAAYAERVYALRRW